MVVVYLYYSFKFNIIQFKAVKKIEFKYLNLKDTI